MKDFGENSHERKKPFNCDNKNIKALLLRIIDRALMDLVGGKLALSRGQVSKNTKSMLRAQALRFLNSEYCLEMCEYCDIDYYSLVAKAQKVVAEYQLQIENARKKRKEQIKTSDEQLVSEDKTN